MLIEPVDRELVCNATPIGGAAYVGGGATVGVAKATDAFQHHRTKQQIASASVVSAESSPQLNSLEHPEDGGDHIPKSAQQPPRTITTTPQNNRGQRADQAAQKYEPVAEQALSTNMPTYDNPLSDVEETEKSLGWLRRIYPGKIIQLCVETFRTVVDKRGSRVRYTISEPAEKAPDVGRIDLNTGDGQEDNNYHGYPILAEQLRHLHRAATSNESLRNLDVSSRLLDIRAVGTTEADQRSLLSNDTSDSGNSRNPYKLEVIVEDSSGTSRDYMVWVRFDNQSGPSFITRGALNRLPGIKIQPVPEGMVKGYISPLADRIRIAPTKFVYLKMRCDLLDFKDLRVKLYILDESDMALVLVGRKLMNKEKHRYHEKGSLLSRIEGLDYLGLIPQELETSPDLNMIAPIDEDRSGKKGKKIDAAIKAQKEKDRKKAQEIKEKINGTKQPGNKERDQGANKRALEHEDSSLSTWCTLEDPGQPIHAPVNEPDFQADFQSQKTDSSLSQSTQFTQYSFGNRATTFSSMSSWGPSRSASWNIQPPKAEDPIQESVISEETL